MERKYASSMECGFLVYTDVDTFARRIAYLTRSIYCEHFDTPGGFITLQTAEIQRADRTSGPDVICMPGRYCAVKEDAGVVHSVSNLSSMILFALSPLRDQKVEVVATSLEPAVEDCFKGLLLQIWCDYLEARPGIEHCWPAVDRVARYPVTVQDFDQEITAILSKHKDCTSTRRETDTAVLHTIRHDGVELGWVKISPGTGPVPGPHVAYGSTALTRFLVARESNRTAEEERPRIHLVYELFADVHQRLQKRRWASERVEPAMPACPPQVKSEPPPSDQYVFRKCGELWEIAYGGEPFYMKDSKGLHYIACLLQHPYAEFDVMALVAAVTKSTAGSDISPQAEEELDSVSDLGDNQAVLDSQAIRDSKKRLAEIRERIIELGEERKKAETLGNTDWQRKIDEDEEKLGKEGREIDKYLRDGTGLHGRSRSFPTPRERERVRIQKQIKAARDKISKHDPALFRHLKSYIRTGYTCSYNPRPDMQVKWENVNF